MACPIWWVVSAVEHVTKVRKQAGLSHFTATIVTRLLFFILSPIGYATPPLCLLAFLQACLGSMAMQFQTLLALFSYVKGDMVGQGEREGERGTAVILRLK